MNADSISASDVGASETELYGHSPGLHRVPLGSAAQLVYCPYDRTSHFVSASEARVLQLCWDFSTLSEHVARCLHDGKLDEASVRSLLQRFIDKRMLVAQADLTAWCLAHKAAGNRPAQIASVCIPTRNRPDMLQRCVESYARCARDFSRRLEFVVVDSSDDESVRERNIQSLSALRKSYGVAIRYLGPDEKRDFAKRLARRGLDPDCVDFAMLNPGSLPYDTGANRNALLLSTVDECTVQVDDDTVCRVMPWIPTTTGVRFTSNFNPTEFAFPDDEGDVPAHRFEGADFFALHESLLGRSDGELIETHSLEAKGFDRLTRRFFRKMERGGARVSITALGVAGDSGMGGSSYFLQLAGRSRVNLMRSERVYRNALVNHRLLRAVPQLTVSDNAYCMTLNLGLDNRCLLPPFMPVLRGEDDIFGALVQSSAEGSFFGYVPWMVSHEPQPRARPDFAASSARLSVGRIVTLLVRAFHPSDAQNPEANLFALAQWLCDIGRAQISDFEELVRLLAWQQASQQIVLMEGMLQRYGGQPEFWARDVARYIRALKESVTGSQYVTPLSLEEMFGEALASARLQRLVLHLGRLLLVWPQLRNAAKLERATGNPIGRPI